MFCVCFGWFEALNDHLIGPKSWNQGVEVFFKPIWTVRDCPRTVWVVNGIICAINIIVVCMRPEMAMKFGFTKLY